MSEWRPGRGVGRGEESDTHTPKKKKEGGGAKRKASRLDGVFSSFTVLISYLLSI